MKRLLLFAAIMAASAGNLSGSPYQSPAAHKQEVAQQSPANPSPVTVIVENAPRGEPASGTAPKSLDGNAAPEWALVIVGIVTCGFIWWQAKKTSEATQAMRDSLPHQAAAVKAAKDSAEAALWNAKAVINAERPWIVVKIKRIASEQSGEPAKPFWQFKMHNCGKSPAHIIGCSSRIDFVVNPEELPLPPSYANSKWNKQLLAPDEGWPIHEAFQATEARKTDMANALEKGDIGGHGELVIYGFIEYRDGISKDSYRTAFCYRHVKGPFESMGGLFVFSGPPVYNDYT
jgi:hypothetical protein